MASLQDALQAATKNITRTLWDNDIRNKGTEAQCLHLRMTKDKYDDTSAVEVLLQQFATLYINFPDEIPLTRYRASSGSAVEVEKTNMYFFEILPIEIYTQWEDHVEAGDFVVYTFEDEEENDLQIILQVVDVLGRPRKYLQWKQQIAAPYTGPLSSAIQTLIDNWEG